jgi:hypothetical protein
MARYNTVSTTGSVAGGNAITTPNSGLLTTLTGSGTVSVPNPVYYAGQSQTFYNSTASTIILNTPSGVFNGPGTGGGISLNLASGAVITIVSDGTNYLTQNWLGGAVIATSISSTGAVTFNPSNSSISLQPTGTGTVTIAPGAVGTIDKMNIGATTAGSGAFTSLTANGSTTLTAGTAVTLGTAASGTLQVTGGVGVSGGLTVANNSLFSGTLGVNVTASVIDGKLVVGGSQTTTNVGAPPSSGTSSTAILRLKPDSRAGGYGETLDFGMNVGPSYGWIQATNYTGLGTNYNLALQPNGGNVGIGISSPTTLLDIRDSTTSTRVNIWSQTSNGQPQLVFLNNTSNSTITTSTGGNTLQMNPGGVNVLNISSNGNVGIGTTPSSWISYQQALEIGAAGAGVPNMGALSARGDYVSLSGNTYLNGSNNWVFKTANQYAYNYYQSGGYHVFQTSTSNTSAAGSIVTFTSPFQINPGASQQVQTSSSFKSFIKSHSAVNSSAWSGSPTSTNIVQTSDYTYTYSYYFYSNTGGYPSCPYSYWFLCPVQKQNSGTYANAQIEIWGMHRGMWGTGYSEYAKILVGSSSDGGGFIIREWQNGAANDSSNRIRVGWMDYNGTYQEVGPYNSGQPLVAQTGNTIGNSYYKMPIFLRIYTNCGADKEYTIRVTTTDPTALGPPYNGALILYPNTLPTSTMYW